MPPRRLFSARSLVFAACAAIALVATTVHADALQNIGKLLKQGQHVQALEQVDKYLAGTPKDAQGRFLKGVILAEMNKPAEAIAVFAKLTEDYPELPEPYNNLAVIYAQQKQYEKSKQALEMAIRTHPSYATAHENLGDIYARLASQAYDKALQLDSSNSSAQIKLATIKDLMSVSARPGGARPGTSAKPTATAEAKPAEAKVPETTPAIAAKPPEAKPAEVKPPEIKVAAAAPAVAKPAEAVKPAPAGNVDAEVARTLDAWLAAWSRKDVKGYLSHYAKDFQTPGGTPRAKWESGRAKRINKPGAINVSYEELRVTQEGDKATARFRQHYKSATLKSGSDKTLVLVRRDGRWLIQRETIGN